MTQILYVCEKCRKLDAHPTHIAGATVSTRLCPLCETNWGKYVRSHRIWRFYLFADWGLRTAQGPITAEQAIWDIEKHREELCRLGEAWLGR